MITSVERQELNDLFRKLSLIEKNAIKKFKRVALQEFDYFRTHRFEHIDFGKSDDSSLGYHFGEIYVNSDQLKEWVDAVIGTDKDVIEEYKVNYIKEIYIYCLWAMQKAQTDGQKIIYPLLMTTWHKLMVIHFQQRRPLVDNVQGIQNEFEISRAIYKTTENAMFYKALGKYKKHFFYDEAGVERLVRDFKAGQSDDLFDTKGKLLSLYDILIYVKTKGITKFGGTRALAKRRPLPNVAIPEFIE